MTDYWPAFLALAAVSALGWFLARLGRALGEEDREESAKVRREERKAGREPASTR